MKISFSLENLQEMNACKELLSFAEGLANEDDIVILDISSPLAWAWLESNGKCWATFLRISPPDNMSKFDFSHIDFSNANFHNVNLQGASFKNCNLQYADFSFADVYRADFTSANLYRANFWAAEFSRTKFDRSNGYKNMYSFLKDFQAQVNTSVADR